MATITELINEATEIRDAELEQENTAYKVGTMLVNIIEYLAGMDDNVTEQFAAYFTDGHLKEAALPSAFVAALSTAIGACATQDSDHLLDLLYSRIILLDSMGSNLDGVNYTPSAGDLVWRNNYVFRWDGSDWGNGIPPRKHVVYINKHTRKLYMYNGSAMVEIGNGYADMIQISKMDQSSVDNVPVGKLHFVVGRNKLVYRISANEVSEWTPSTKLIYIDASSNTIYRWQGSVWVALSSGSGEGVVNDLTTGGEGVPLSAEMGKVLRQNLMAIYNALGAYAFPNGKPTLNWGSTIINHDISISGVTGLSISDIEVDGESVAQMPSQIIDYKSLSFKMAKTASQIYSSVAISMGGLDITEDAGVWDENTGTVNIAHVTGNIVVVASALTLVEYLQSDGNQWIDTGIIASTNFKCNVKADIITQPDTMWRRLLSAYNNNKYGVAIGVKPAASGGTIYSQIGDVIPAVFVTSSAQQTTGLHTITVQAVSGTYSINVDGTVDSVAYTDLGNPPDLTLYLFSEHRLDDSIRAVSAKVYHCKIWNGNNLVFDAVPVRVGQVGYMYDKVSDELLPNIGTGSFTLGNDLTV